MNAWILGSILLAMSIVTAVLFVRFGPGGRKLPEALEPGNELPEFSALDEQGNTVSTDQLRGTPAVILFVRGNWCPFCSRQVANLTRSYKKITDMGARLILVTPRPLETTRRVAEFFAVEFDFWLDEELAAGTTLGLIQKDGVPQDHRAEYGDDTLWPAAIVIDGDGIIRYASISKVLADRPNPEHFVRALESISG